MNNITFDNFKSDKSLPQIITEEKDFIYPLLFYIAGVILGAFGYVSFSGELLNKALKTLINVKTDSFLSLFIGNFSVYATVFAITLLLGLCIIGYPVINAVPFVMGTAYGLKIAFFYVTYSVKGIGYSLLLIIPEAAAIVTILLFTIKESSLLSKTIAKCTSKNNQTGEYPNAKTLLKKYLLYLSAVTGISAINALLTYLLSAIINL